MDIIGFNRYNAWYTLPGRTEIIKSRLEDEATKWHVKHNKPVFMTEYGADTLPGLHMVFYTTAHAYVRYNKRLNLLFLSLPFQSPSFVWSEEYQVELMSEHFKAFDVLRNKEFFIGEMIWNFADFKTEQSEWKPERSDCFSKITKRAKHYVPRETTRYIEINVYFLFFFKPLRE